MILASKPLNSIPMQVFICGVYRDHLRSINPDDLPENIKIINEFAIDRFHLVSKMPAPSIE